MLEVPGRSDELEDRARGVVKDRARGVVKDLRAGFEDSFL